MGSFVRRKPVKSSHITGRNGARGAARRCAVAQQSEVQHFNKKIDKTFIIYDNDLEALRLLAARAALRLTTGVISCNLLRAFASGRAIVDVSDAYTPRTAVRTVFW